MNAAHRKVIGLADLGGSGILGANMSGFAIEVAGQGSRSPTQPTIERLTTRRRGGGLRGYDPERAGRSAFTQSSLRHRRVARCSASRSVRHSGKRGGSCAGGSRGAGSATRWPSSTIGCCATSA